MRKEDLTDQEYEDIINLSDEIAASLIAQFASASPKGATCLQLGILKALSMVWASCCSADPKLIFESLMGTMPLMLQNKSKYVH
jgi:hypothetical protein